MECAQLHMLVLFCDASCNFYCGCSRGGGGRRGRGPREESEEGGAESTEDAQVAPEGRADGREAVVEALLERAFFPGCDALAVAGL